MGVSENSGTPKSPILIGFSIINHPFWGTTTLGNTHIYIYIHYIYFSLLCLEKLEVVLFFGVTSSRSWPEKVTAESARGRRSHRADREGELDTDLASSGMMRYVWHFVYYFLVSSYTFITFYNILYIQAFHSSEYYRQNPSKYDQIWMYSLLCIFCIAFTNTSQDSHRFWPLGLYERGPPKATGRAAEAASITAISITVPWVAALRRWSTVGHHHNKEVSSDLEESNWKISQRPYTMDPGYCTTTWHHVTLSYYE